MQDLNSSEANQKLEKLKIDNSFCWSEVTGLKKYRN